MRKQEIAALVSGVIIAIYGYTQYHHQAYVPETEVADGPPVIEASSVGSAPDFSAISDVKEKKQAFFDYLRPGVALENQRVKSERQRLLNIEQRLLADTLTSEDTSYAKRMGKLYSNPLPANGVDQTWLTTMLTHVNVLPEALVLTQAANESAWGTSRFATQANNYFGQWCYSEGCGMVPLQRTAGKTHEVAKFRSAQESIHRYFMNVNRNRAYQALREIRDERYSEALAMTSPDAALALSEGLLRYSERGEAYVKDLQAMIRHNQAYWQ